MPSLEETVERYVYAIKSGQFIKVGVATSVAKRMHDMRLLNPHEIKLVYRRKMRAAFHCEKKVHEVLRDKAVGREWFDASVEEVRAAITLGLAYAREVRANTADKYYYFSGTQQTQTPLAKLEVIAEAITYGNN